MLGRSGIKVSEIGFGTWGLGGNSYGTVDDSISVKALAYASENGINFFDTADLYGSGHSEEIIAKALKNKRQEVIIASKGGTLPHSGFYMPQDFSKVHLENALAGSLKKLQTDYIDVYQLHSPQIDDVEKYDVINTLENFKAAGKIREFGVSVRSPKDAVIAIEKYNFAIVQVNYNMIDQRARELNLFKIACKHNAGLIIRTPLVFGYLTGQLTGREQFEGIDHRANWPKEQLERWANAPNLFQDINENKNRSLVQLALQFCLFDKAVSTVIPGMMNIREVEENIVASELKEITIDEINRIKSIYLENDFYDNNAKCNKKK
jgi:aryl-alcohol dehydrogenase-like predicted oxidoreductase